MHSTLNTTLDSSPPYTALAYYVGYTRKRPRLGRRAPRWLPSAVGYLSYSRANTARFQLLWYTLARLALKT